MLHAVEGVRVRVGGSAVTNGQYFPCSGTRRSPLGRLGCQRRSMERAAGWAGTLTRSSRPSSLWTIRVCVAHAGRSTRPTRLGSEKRRAHVRRRRHRAVTDPSADERWGWVYAHICVRRAFLGSELSDLLSEALERRRLAIEGGVWLGGGLASVAELGDVTLAHRVKVGASVTSECRLQKPLQWVVDSLHHPFTSISADTPGS